MSDFEDDADDFDDDDFEDEIAPEGNRLEDDIAGDGNLVEGARAQKVVELEECVQFVVRELVDERLAQGHAARVQRHRILERIKLLHERTKLRRTSAVGLVTIPDEGFGSFFGRGPAVLPGPAGMSNCQDLNFYIGLFGSHLPGRPCII